MKNTCKKRFFALLLCLTLLVSCLPMTAFAESAENFIDMIAGDVIVGFAPAGSDCTSTDESIAWVDDNGNLNALKSGTATVTVPSEEGQTEYTVNVSDFSDGSQIVGNLKILARFNDSMQFYDGHVYLLFTSYQDGVTIAVPDLYAGYEIDDSYYDDIAEDISNGSNHTGNDAEKYFTFSDDMNSVTLDRGEIVTIGMYRDFDLSVKQAALGSIQNSSLWTELVSTGKSEVIKMIFGLIETGKLSTDEAVAKLKTVFDEAGMDYNKALNGVVDGGVCFNRELYNQKLEWDQYENVTYEMDITENQLNMMQLYLRGNLNKFSILKNSCATVALRAWNAAVGTRNGEDTAYKLTAEAEGIYSMIDAPKGVRDNIVSRLPGYYLNNAEGVAEPDAGYQDDTGWVYVSAPDKVAPVILVHEDNTLFIDENKTKAATLLNAAKADNAIYYNKDEQDIDVSINKIADGDFTTVNDIDFNINGTVVTLNADNMPESGVWFKTWIENPAEGEDYYVVDADGKALASEFADGWLSFYAPTLPLTYKIVSSSEGAQNLLKTVVVNGDKVKAVTEIYTVNGEDKAALDNIAEVSSGKKIFVKSTIPDDENNYLLTDITMNGVSILDDEHYDEAEGAYYATMPEKYSTLTVTYEKAQAYVIGKRTIQMKVGESVQTSDVAELLIGDAKIESDALTWFIIDPEESVVEKNGRELIAKAAGDTTVWVHAEGNINIGAVFAVEVFDQDAELVTITFSDETEHDIYLTYTTEDGEEDGIPFSGYQVPKGTVLNIVPFPDRGKAVLYLHANDKTVSPGETYTATEDTEIDIKTVDEVVTGMPNEIKLKAKGDTYQLDAKVKYSGLWSIITPYDGSIEYESSDELIAVDENGLITVVGDVPEDGAVVYVAAYAGSTFQAVRAMTKVIVGNYSGADIVGSLTIHSRSINKGELIAHGCITFTSYEDIDFDASYYHYYWPNDKYNDLMVDYEDNPEKYSSDPALYSMNELGIEDRESYFDTYSHGAMSEPGTVSLQAGESFTVSNYGFDPTNLIAVYRALEGGMISSSAEAQALIDQMKKYSNGEEIDGELAFDSLFATILQIYAISKATGLNPADGHSEGGLVLNREIYNQFRRNDSQLPNNYYTIEITADELEQLKLYLADSNNNYYSFMSNNCASGVVDIWNSVLFDKPELELTANLTGVATDPQSLYFNIGELALKDGLYDYDGYGGTDFYPRTIRYNEAVKDTIAKIKAIGEIELTDECIEKIDAAREAFDALSDTEKDRVWNIDELIEAEKAYDELKTTADKAEFEEYKKSQKEAVAALEQEDDNFVSKMLIGVTESLIDTIRYDEKKSLDENKAVIDAVVDELKKVLEEQRLASHNILGDANLDDVVDITDATTIQRYDVQMIELDKTALRLADVDKDGVVNIIDAAWIQRYDAKMKSIEGIGEPI